MYSVIEDNAPQFYITDLWKKVQQREQNEKEVYDLSVVEMNGISLVELTAFKQCSRYSE